MIKILICLLVLTNIISCATVSTSPKTVGSNFNLEEILNNAEANTSNNGRRILETSRAMISDKEIVVGGCWNYINKVYNRAGFSTKQRLTIFKSKLKGPYVKGDRIEPGDWLYFVNHSYSGSEHSAIFVDWTDEERKLALMVSYEGENRKKPAMYKEYNLSNIYNIIRAND
ncbi:MAG: hypothetical protein HOP07_15220 [Bacteriovoracaceae bacterium]|nr:hypothetical protein [Bacteriovoracaceae bacterium]